MPPNSQSDAILQALRARRGAATSAELQAELGVSQPTVSRALAPLIQDGQVMKVGSARSQLYLLPRQVPRVGGDIPVIQVDADGNTRPFGRIVPLQGGRCWMDEVAGASALHDGLPWFLSDMRPQGFIGRSYAQGHPELGLPANPQHWSDDDVLQALALAGEDLPGNLIVGAPSYRRYHALQPLAQTASVHDYPAMAERALLGTLPGSPAGGEQPKFCTVREGRHVIVKFSAAGDSAADRRSRDLLVCEHLALDTLAGAGMAAAKSTVFVEAGRVFLEVQRFDRSARGAHRHGVPAGLRRAVRRPDGQLGRHCQPHGRAPAAPRRRCAAAALSGGLRRADRQHRPALREHLAADRRRPDMAPVPSYDMLPMLYAASAGELVARDLAGSGLVPTADTLPVWEAARELAVAFWRRTAGDGRISAAFRKLARGNADRLSRPRP